MEVRFAPDGCALSLFEQRRSALECKDRDIAAPDFHGAYGGVEPKAAIHAGGRGGPWEDSRSRHGLAGAVATGERSAYVGRLPGGIDATVAGRVSRKVSAD